MYRKSLVTVWVGVLVVSLLFLGCPKKKPAPASDVIELQETVVEEGRQAARLASIQYDVGIIDFLSVIQVQDTFVNAQRRLLGLKDKRLANRINLHLSLGGSF